MPGGGVRMHNNNVGKKYPQVRASCSELACVILSAQHFRKLQTSDAPISPPY